MTDIYLNDKYLGEIEEANPFIEQFKTERRKGNIPNTANASYDEASNMINIESRKGRARRPVIIVKDGIPLLTENHLKQLEKNEITWADLVNQGIIEFLDAAEEENSLIAFSEKDLTTEHTHMEITPMDMMGLATSLVPFANHSPTTRINMGSKNQKQALGFYAANFLVRMDMDVNLLISPQVPITRTIMHDIYADEKHPAGQNIVLAILSYEGYNMEDCVIINKSSIEYGLGRSSYFRPANAEELRYSGGLVDEISIPDKEVKGYRTERDYRFLEDDGIVHPEAQVKEGDVVIGKTSPPRFLSGMDEYNLASNVRRESSVAMKHGEQGTIDFVMITENEEGLTFKALCEKSALAEKVQAEKQKKQLERVLKTNINLLFELKH